MRVWDMPAGFALLKGRRKKCGGRLFVREAVALLILVQTGASVGVGHAIVGRVIASSENVDTCRCECELGVCRQCTVAAPGLRALQSRAFDPALPIRKHPDRCLFACHARVALRIPMVALAHSRSFAFRSLNCG